MEAHEFATAIENADLDLLLKDQIDDFLDYVRNVVFDGKDEAVIRCSMETNEEDYAMPYYVWLVYAISQKGEFLGLSAKQFYIPKSDDLKSYYKVPYSLQDKEFFPVVID